MSSTGDCCGCCFLCCSCFSICGHSSSLLSLCSYIPCCCRKDASVEEGSEGDPYSGDRQMYEDRHREAALFKFQSQPIATNDMKTSTDLSSNPNATGNIRDKSLIRCE
ncbi:hypothetical protein K443DRAFT_90621 [Laccaria amethystina LaAM-08-1]|uniref:Uncharacterized protein n=1 Tax=Laccaria amethystina LaAM-08-1 TaxID=1095629 RepID=A0A0C9Y6D9_9AGAR|nr:hypothetical protein K443DRAFT_90621 [Laccaria amethystina LaAM-08-1]